jgi:hypothetical protein
LILKLKTGEYRFVNFWNNLVSACLNEMVSGWYKKHEGFWNCNSSAFVYVVRALGSSETGQELTAHPLDEICKTIVQALPNAKYMSGLIKKKRACRELKLLSLEDKRKEVEGLYYLDEGKIGDGMSERPHFLIVDDVFTSGTTVSEIAGVLKARFGCQVSVFTLAKTARPEYSDIRDNSHFTGFNPYLRSQFPGMKGAPHEDIP